MKYIYLSFLLTFFISCNGQQNKTTIEDKETPLVFEMVSLPSLLTEPAERADYLVRHYWDNFDFTDIRYVDVPEVTEQAFVDYISILYHVPAETASSSIQQMLVKAEAEKKMYDYFVELYEKYLYDPNSPMRDEELYIPVLEAMIKSSKMSDVEKIRPAHRLEIAMKNRVGKKATNFTYTLANGKTSSLYDISADFIVLYFYNPDCGNCKEVSAQLRQSPVVTRVLKNGKLKILAIYPDEDLTEWKEHLHEVPSEWINSYDAEFKIKDDEIYDLKAIPTIYLLDKEKQVVLKDTTFEMLENYLNNI